MIYLDMDGVLANFVDSFLAMDEYTVTHDEITTWDMQDILGISRNEMWRRINSYGEDFWVGLKEYPWMQELMDLLKNYGDVVICSSPGDSPAACSGKLKWIQKRFEKQKFIFTSEKHLLANHCSRHLLVDDSDGKCRRFAFEGGQTIVFPQPWNSSREYVGDRMGYVKERLDKLGW